MTREEQHARAVEALQAHAGDFYVPLLGDNPDDPVSDLQPYELREFEFKKGRARERSFRTLREIFTMIQREGEAALAGRGR
jgi:hypothetical protein